MKKTIVFVDFLPIGGSCTGLLSQIRHMKRMYPDQYRFVVVGTRSSILEENEDQLLYKFYSVDNVAESKEWKMHPVRSLYNYCRIILFLLRIARTEHVDILHCNHYMWSVYVNPIGLILRKPVVVHLKDVWLLQPKLARILMKCNLRSLYVAVSDYVRQLFIGKYRLPHSRTVRIYDGIDGTIYAPISKRKISEKADGKKKDIIMVSRVAQERDIEIFLETAAVLAKKHRYLRFIHYGYDSPNVDHAYFLQLKKRVTALGLRSRFMFHRYIRSPYKMAKVYQHAYVSIICARQFALPNVAIESHMCGTPVVAYNTGGNREIITNGVSGVLLAVDSPSLFASELEKLFRNPRRYIRFATQGIRLSSEKFSIQTYCKKLDAIYRHIG